MRFLQSLIPIQGVFLHDDFRLRIRSSHSKSVSSLLTICQTFDLLVSAQRHKAQKDRRFSQKIKLECHRSWPPLYPSSPLITPHRSTVLYCELDGQTAVFVGKVTFYSGLTDRAFKKYFRSYFDVCLSEEERSPSATTSSAFRLTEEEVAGPRTAVVTETKRQNVGHR